MAQDCMHVGNEQGKVVTRKSKGKGKDRELRVSLLRDISGSRPENFKTKPLCQRLQGKKSHEEIKALSLKSLKNERRNWSKKEN